MKNNSEIEIEFLEHVRKHQGILHKICFIYARSEADREDLYQEITLQLWKSYPGFRRNSAFSTWMYKVALNTAIGMTKKARLFFEDVKIPDLCYSNESSMELSEDVKILYMAISQLKKVEKAIILLWLEERSYDEIGEMIGISVKNVSVKLVRIKVKLAGLIQKLQ